jgi:hypothetical protein
VKLDRVLGATSAVIGIGLLLFTFYSGFMMYEKYAVLTPSGNLTSTMGTLLFASIQALFLGIMGWVGSLLMLRGIEFEKVEKGIGIVTLRVDKNMVGILSEEKKEEPKQR